MEYSTINILIVFIFGIIVGLSELINRYPEIRYTFKVWFSYLYLFLNGIFSVGGLFLLKYFKAQSITSMSSIEINNIILAGFGGMMILRSSLFSIKHKDEKIEIGLGAIAQIFLDAIEKKMNANAAVIRLDRISTLMEDIDFEKAASQLSTLCISYIDNFSKEDQTNLTREIERIKDFSDLNNHNKVLQLGRYISMYCDYDVLQKAIEVLGDDIKTTSNGNFSIEDINYWINKIKDGKDPE